LSTKETPRGIEALHEMVDRLAGARPEAAAPVVARPAPSFAPQRAAAPGRDAAEEFTAVKDYLIARYANVEVSNSFVDDAGQTIDCIRMDQQAAIRGGQPASPPDIDPEEGLPRASLPAAAAAPLAMGRSDVFQNRVYCPEGFVPVVRVTPERISQAGGLAQFFEKAPGGGRHPMFGSGSKKARAGAGGDAGGVAAPFQSVGGAIHAYAHASQWVGNELCTGARSWLNLWTPNPSPGVFSLSQQWLAGDDGTGLQTIEGGWHVYPSLYNDPTPKTRLFIYWTADGYQTTGNYNLSPRPGQSGFVQTDNSWVIGGTFAASESGGAQRGFLMQWVRDPANGNWWLYLQGTGNLVPVGYFPASIYGRGALSRSAMNVDFGGEVCSQPGSGQTGPMGSGQFASAGWQRAAFHKQIAYLTSGGWVNATLTPDQRDAPAYTLDLHNNSNSAWGTYFFFGGQGGQFP
jgi:hypothetical protein